METKWLPWPLLVLIICVVSGRASIEEDGLSLADRDEPDDTVADDGPVLVFNYTDAVLSSDDTPAGDDPEEMTTAPPFVPNPGFKGRVTQRGLDYARDVAVDVMMEELMRLEIPDMEQEISGLDVEMTNIRITHFPRPVTALNTIPGVGLRWHTMDLRLTVHADYRSIIGIGFFKITKTGSVTMTGHNLFFDLHFAIGRTPDGKPDITVQDCRAGGAIFLDFEGGWSDTLNFGAALGQNNIRDLILAQLCSNARHEIEVNAAQAMHQFSVTHTFEEVFELDFRLVQYPEFYEEAFETFHKGEISYISNGTRVEAPFSPPEIPPTPSHNDKMAYVYVTDYFINTGLYAAYRSGKLAINITADTLPEAARSYLSTSCTLSLCLGTLFPQLAEDYPNGMGMMRVYAASSPHVEFVGGEAAVNASANAAVYIDVEGQEAAHILTINVNMNALFTVAMQDQRLVFSIVDITPEATITDSAFSSEGTSFFFNTMVRLVTQQFLVPKLAEIGEEGIQLPEIPEVTLVEPEVYIDPEVPHVVTISSDINYDPEETTAEPEVDM